MSRSSSRRYIWKRCSELSRCLVQEGSRRPRPPARGAPHRLPDLGSRRAARRPPLSQKAPALRPVYYSTARSTLGSIVKGQSSAATAAISQGRMEGEKKIPWQLHCEKEEGERFRLRKAARALKTREKKGHSYLWQYFISAEAKQCGSDFGEPDYTGTLQCINLYIN